MANSSSLRDLELLMDHNISHLRSSSPTPIPCLPPDSTHSFSSHPAAIPSLPDAPPSPSPSSSFAFAALSLASLPAMSSSPFLSPHISRRGLGPHLRGPSSSSKSLGIALPSQQKSACPTPIMPAITAAALAPDMVSTAPAKGIKRSNTAFPDYARLPENNDGLKEPNGGAAMRRASIVWFRNDLRCHDNEALTAASKESLSVLPVYCFDPRDYGKSTSGFDKTGPYRAKFLVECVSVLRQNLRERGSDLVVRIGKAEEVLVDLAKKIGAEAVYAHQEVSCEEVQCEKLVSAALKEEGIDVNFFWGSTLFHIDDLPFKLENMPVTYSGFREKVQNLSVRQPLDALKQLKSLPTIGGVKPGNIPTLDELGLRPISAPKQDGKTVAGSTSLVGGEVEALKRLQGFSQDQIKQWGNKSVTGGCVESPYGSNFSCKISPWLAMGCLSPRRMFEDLRNGSKSATSVSMSAGSINDKGLNWLVFELLWRDFFRFITRKYAAGKDGVAASATSEAIAV